MTDRLLKAWLNQEVKPCVETNTFKPNHISDAERKAFFTTFDEDKIRRIRQIKLRNSLL